MCLNSLQRGQIYAITGVFLRVQAHWCSSRLPWQPRQDEFMLTDDREDDDPPQGFHRWRPLDQNRCKIFLLLLGLLLMFGIGTQHKSRELTSLFLTSLVPTYNTYGLTLTRLPGWQCKSQQEGAKEQQWWRRLPREHRGRRIYISNISSDSPFLEEHQPTSKAETHKQGL